jgi:hypothetical protein
MIGPLFAILFAVLLVAIVRFGERKQGVEILQIVLGGYLLRLLLQLFIRDVKFFSHEAGGDCEGYEIFAMEIARYWHLHGLSFMTQDDLPVIGPTALPPNLFAGIIYLNGGEATRLGCTALIALAAGLTCYNLYHLAVELGADPRIARWTMALFYLSPTYLHYTGDMFKDGLVVFFVVSALASSVRLMRRFSALHLVIGAMSLWALWYVRYYLIYVTVAPLLVGLLGVRSKSVIRPLIGALLLVAAGLAILGLMKAGQEVSQTAVATFARGTDVSNRDANAGGGSGVTFDDGGSPYGQLWLKLLYTLLAPFPWSSGSIAFQVGKIDVLIIAFFLYRAWKVVRTQELRLVGLMIATFAVPCTVMYATSVANVGLIARQRLVIVVAVAFLASLYRPAFEKQVATGDVPSPPDLPPDLETLPAGAAGWRSAAD